MNNDFILQKIKGKLIISAQAGKFEPLYNEIAMNSLIETIVSMGHVDCLRLAGARDIKNTKNKYGDKVVIIGITKPDIIPDNYKELVYITPDINSAKEIVDYIHRNNKLAMGDIGDYDDAKYAYNIGCDIISTTLSGYTKETENLPDTPDFELLEKSVKTFDVPIIMEGKIWDNSEVKKAFTLGAHSVVIGSAITRPHKIIEKFKKGL